MRPALELGEMTESTNGPRSRYKDRSISPNSFSSSRSSSSYTERRGSESRTRKTEQRKRSPYGGSSRRDRRSHHSRHSARHISPRGEKEHRAHGSHRRESRDDERADRISSKHRTRHRDYESHTRRDRSREKQRYNDGHRDRDEYKQRDRYRDKHLHSERHRRRHEDIGESSSSSPDHESRIPNKKTEGFEKKQSNEPAEDGRNTDISGDTKNASETQIVDLVDDASESETFKKLFGFSSFKSTSNTKVLDRGIGASKIQKQSTYRQYMNRRWGFNRNLSPTK